MKSSNGKLMIGKKTIVSLGALAKHDDGKPDYLKRLRESFSDGKPLIKELEPYVGQGRTPAATASPPPRARD